MKRKVIILIGIGILITAGVLITFFNREIPTEAKIEKESALVGENFDITNEALENYLNGIEDAEKKELLKKYFYLPSELISEDVVDSSLDPVSQAEILSKLSKEKLKTIIDGMEEALPELQKEQNEKYEESMKEINEE